LKAFYILETKSLLFLADTWLSQFIVNIIPLIIKIEKVAESLREDTFLEKSLLIITLEAVSILGFKTILSFLLSPKVDKVIALENTFLEIEEAEILRSRNTS